MTNDKFRQQNNSKYAIIIVWMVMYMENYRLSLLLLKNTARLEKFIETGKPMSKILKQSRKVDSLINQKIKISKK